MSRQATRAQRRRESRQAPRHDQPHRAGRRAITRTQLIGASIFAVLAVVALVWAGTAASNAPATTLPPTVTQSGHTRGQANAPVVIEEWADFQCPACGQFARQTEPQLLSTYVAKGQVAIVFHHMAFLGLESNWAAEAAECAGEQGKFFEYHDKLYASQAGENNNAFSKDNLKRFGTDLGLGPAFASCVDSSKYQQAVRDDTKVGQGRGVTATPTLFVNGRKIEGAASFDQLKTVIDPLLLGR
jgi:protein-disulfide isomerase